MIKKFFSSQLHLNMASGVVAGLIQSVATIVAFPIYLHFLGYETYGVWLVLTTVLSFAQLGNLGIGQAVMKLVAEEHGRDNKDGIQRYISAALTILTLSGIVALTIILVMKNQIVAAFNLNDKNAEIVRWLLPYIGVLSIYVFVVQALNATLSGLGRMDLANYTHSLGRFVCVSISTLLLCLGWGIKSLLLGNVISYVFVHVTSLFFIRRIISIRILKVSNLDAHHCKSLLRFGGTVFGGSLMSMFFSPFNKLMLARYAGVDSIPVYEIAFNASMQIRGLIEVGLKAIVPEVSKINGSTKVNVKKRVSYIYQRILKLIFAVGTPLYLFLILMSPFLLKIWLGDKCIPPLPTVFRIMLVGTFLSLIGVPAYYTLMGLGKVKKVFISHSIQTGINLLVVIGLAILSVAFFNVATVSFAVMAAMFSSTLYLLYQQRIALKHIVIENRI